MKSLEILWYELLQCDLPVHLFLYYLKESIRPFRIKDFIAGHNRNQIFGMGQINNIMSPSGNHVDSFDPISTYLKFHSLSGIDIPLLDQAMSMHYNKLFPLGIMLVLALGDSRFTDINGNLAAILSMYQLSKRTSVITVHFHGIFKPVCRKIGKIQGKKLLCKRTHRHFGYHQIYWLLLELLQQIHNLT